MKINWTEAKKSKVIRLVEEWLVSHKAISGEHVGQCDECLVDAVDLVADLADAVGGKE